MLRMAVPQTDGELLFVHAATLQSEGSVSASTICLMRGICSHPKGWLVGVA